MEPEREENRGGNETDCGRDDLHEGVDERMERGRLWVFEVTICLD